MIGNGSVAAITTDIEISLGLHTSTFVLASMGNQPRLVGDHLRGVSLDS